MHAAAGSTCTARHQHAGVVLHARLSLVQTPRHGAPLPFAPGALRDGMPGSLGRGAPVPVPWADRSMLVEHFDATGT